MEGEYRAAINCMGRATAGTFRTSPLGIVAAKSALTPARALRTTDKRGSCNVFSPDPRRGGGQDWRRSWDDAKQG